MGGACCGGSNRKIVLANNQQELKQFVDDEIKIIKQDKLMKENLTEAKKERMEKDLISHCYEISNNLGRKELEFKDFESANHPPYIAGGNS